MKQKHIPMPVRYGINLAVIAVIFFIGNSLLSSGAVSRASTTIVMQAGIYIILAVSLNVTTGYLGQLPLGHAGFMAVGAYAGSIFWKSGLLPGAASVVGGLLAAGVVAAIFGILIGVPALRLKGDYLAIITLGFGEIIRVVIINLSGITGGAQGLMSIPKHTTFSLIYLCIVVTCVTIHMIMKSRHGRAILAIKENEIAAESCGINTTYYKVMAFCLSAFFAGIAGALYAGNLGSLFPSKFDFMMSIDILVMVVLGGMGSMAGSIIAAALLTALPQLLKSFGHYMATSSLPDGIVNFFVDFDSYRMILYSLVLILVMIRRPSGLLGTYDFSLSRILEKIMGRFSKDKKPGKGGAAA